MYMLYKNKYQKENNICYINLNLKFFTRNLRTRFDGCYEKIGKIIF